MYHNDSCFWGAVWATAMLGSLWRNTVTISVHEPQRLKRKESQNGIERRPQSAYQSNAQPLAKAAHKGTTPPFKPVSAFLAASIGGLCPRKGEGPFKQ